jgi:hypothetical protein
MLSWPLIDFVNYGVFRGALNGSVGVRWFLKEVSGRGRI